MRGEMSASIDRTGSIAICLGLMSEGLVYRLAVIVTDECVVIAWGVTGQSMEGTRPQRGMRDPRGTKATLFQPRPTALLLRADWQVNPEKHAPRATPGRTPGSPQSHRLGHSRGLCWPGWTACSRHRSSLRTA
jgi:hypothetical protein